MAATIKQRGWVGVSVGLVFTGLLWYQRDSAAIRGEDYAELASAAIERRAVAYGVSNMVPTQAGGMVPVIPVAMSTGRMRDMIMDPLRVAATNSPDALPAVLWVTEPLENMVLCGYDGDEWVLFDKWTNQMWGCNLYNGVAQEVYEYRLAPPSNNVWECAETTAALIPGTYDLLFMGTAPSNYPLAKLFYPGHEARATYEVGRAWWERIGVATSMYKYGYETGVREDVMQVRTIGSGGYSLGWGDFAFGEDNYNQAQTITVTNISGRTAGGAAVYRVVTGTCGSDVVAVAHMSSQYSDNGSYSMPVVTTDMTGVGKSLAVIGQGDTVDLRFYPGVGMVGMITLEFTFVGEISGSVDSVTFRDNDSASLRVTCGENQGGIVKIHYPAAGTTKWFPVINPNRDPGNKLTVTPQTRVVNPIDVTEVSFTAQAGAAPGATRVAYAAPYRAQNLYEANSVATNLNRSIYIMRASDLWAGGYVATSYQSGLGKGVEGFVDLWDDEGFDFEFMGSSFLEGPWRITQPILSYRVSGGRDRFTWYEDDDVWKIEEGSGVEGVVHTLEYTGIALPYPSAQALNMGLVKKVAVHGVLRVVVDDLDAYGVYWTERNLRGAPNLKSVSLHYDQGGWVEVYKAAVEAFGGEMPESAVPDLPRESGGIYECALYGRGQYENRPPQALILHKLKEYDVAQLGGGSGGLPAMSLGFSALPAIPRAYMATEGSYNTEFEANDGTIIGETGEEKRKSTGSVSLHLEYILIEVEWDWQHPQEGDKGE